MTPSESERLAEFSSAVRESTLGRLRLVPEGHENWRITEKDMSFADLARHLFDADEWTFKKLEAKTLETMVGRQDLVYIQRREDYEALLCELEETGTRRAALLREMTQAKLCEMILDERFGGEVTVWWIIVRGNLDHEIHHRGQIATYLSAVRKSF